MTEGIERRRIEALERALIQLTDAIQAVRIAEDAYIRDESEANADTLQDAWATVIIRENKAREVLR